MQKRYRKTVIMCQLPHRLPHRYDKPELNDKIDVVNNFIASEVRKRLHWYFLKHSLTREDFKSDGLHFNLCGATKNAHEIQKIIENVQLTHWGRVKHICISKLTIYGSGNGLVPGQCQAIIWTNAGILLIGPLGTNFSESLFEINTVSFKKMHLKMLSAKWQWFYLRLNVLK